MATESTQQGSGQRTRTRGRAVTGEYQPRGQYAELESPGGGRFARPDPARLALGLGWFSIGLGVVQLLAPQAASRFAGTRREHGILMRLIGLREIACGVGLLSRRRSGGWLQARAVGDVMDLALLAPALRADNPYRGRALLATTAVAGVTALDAFGARELSREDSFGAGALGLRDRAAGRQGMPVEKSVTVNRASVDCYQFWRDFTNLPRFMKHLESVTIVDERRSHWVARAPGGTQVQWDSEIVEDVPDHYIAWRSRPAADVDNAGSVRFEPAPGGRGTIVRVQMRYMSPAGRAGALVAKLFHEEPSQQVREDLRRFKQVLETGEIPTTVGQTAGHRSAIGRALRKGERYAS